MILKKMIDSTLMFTNRNEHIKNNIYYNIIIL